METFQSIKQLKEKYLTQKELIDFLKFNGYFRGSKTSSIYATISRWEKLKLISPPLKARVGKIVWRVYKQEDFNRILEELNRYAKKIIVNP
jgi:hypothetical protein